MRKGSEMALLRATDCAVLFRACHHFPFLSIIFNISPLENEISLESSGDAVYAYNAFALYGYAVSEATLESAGNGGRPPTPMPALPGVLISGYGEVGMLARNR